MNILSSINIPFTHEKGSMVFAKNLYESILDNYEDTKIHLIVLDNPKNLNSTIKLYPIAGKIIRSARSIDFIDQANRIFNKAVKIIKNTQIDILHAHHLSFPHSLAFSKIKHLFPQIPLICSSHGTAIMEAQNDSSHIQYIKIMSEYADSILSPTYFLADEISFLYPKAKEKINIIPLAVGNEIYNYLKKPNHKLNQNQIKILHSGRLTKNKGVDILIQAMKYLPNNFFLRIAGNGEELDRLKKISTELTVDNQVTFLGHLEWSELKKEYADADIFFINTQYFENFPQSLIEAMSCFNCPVGTNIGGIPEILKDCGFIIKPHDINQIIKVLQYLTNNPNKISEYSTNARKKIENNFTYDIIASRYYNHFMKFINHHSA